MATNMSVEQNLRRSARKNNPGLQGSTPTGILESSTNSDSHETMECFDCKETFYAANADTAPELYASIISKGFRWHCKKCLVAPSSNLKS